MFTSIRDWLSYRSGGEVAIIIAAILLCIGISGWSITHTMEEFKPEETPVNVDYMELFRHTENYNGQLVRIVGRVGENYTDNFGNRVIVFNDRFNNLRQNIYIILENDMTEYNRSEIVAVVGRVSNKNGGLLNITHSEVEATGDEARALYDEINSAENDAPTSPTKIYR